MTGSPAIDAAGPDCPPPGTDQRGVVRPQGAACDIGSVEFSAAPVAPAGEFLDISTRGFVGTGANVLIGGFIIEKEPMTVLIRAIGPSLALPPFSVPGVLTNPLLQLFSGPTPIALNDSWQTDTNSSLIPVGLRPSNSLEAALLVTLEPGVYTGIVSGVGGTTGVALVEVIAIRSGSVEFSAAPVASAGEFLDVSTRGFVGTGANVLIGGFIIEKEPMTVLIRAIGPSLALPPFSVPGVLANPVLQLFAGPTPIALNDSWQTDTNSSLIPVGLRPANSAEAALLVTLEPGVYTGIVSGVGDTTGVALVEVIAIRSGKTDLLMPRLCLGMESGKSVSLVFSRPGRAWTRGRESWAEVLLRIYLAGKLPEIALRKSHAAGTRR